MSTPAQDPRHRAAPAADSNTTAPQLRDASPTAPRLPDHGPLDDGEFARVVREPVKVGHADRRVLAAAQISAGNLNTFLRALRTLVTHGTNAICSFCRKPKDVWNELEFNRTTFYRYLQTATALRLLKTSPGGSRGIVKFDMPRRGGTLHEVDEQSRSAGLFANAPATSSPAQRDCSSIADNEQSRSAGLFANAPATSSPAQRDSSRTPTTTHRSSYHHHLGGTERASENQVRKLCVLDRTRGCVPDEQAYRQLSRGEAWELIAERERTTTTHARPPATDAQIAFAVDLGIDSEGKDLVQLGEEIELAESKRTELRTAAAKKTASTPSSAARNGRRLSAIEQRRLAEAEAHPPTPRREPRPKSNAEAARRLQAGLEHAFVLGFRRAPDDPCVLVRQGQRIRIPELATISID